jgi:hypothetical protein
MSGWSKPIRFVVKIALALTVDNVSGGATGCFGDNQWGILPSQDYIESGAWMIPPVFGGVVGPADDIGKTGGNLLDDAIEKIGKWIDKNEFMSDAARKYQRFISGRADDLVYEINGYSFDGFDEALGILKDAKNIPENFVDSSGNFKPWLSGADDWVSQAENQIAAANGLKIEWHFNSQSTRDAMHNLFMNRNPDLLEHITLVFTPME